MNMQTKSFPPQRLMLRRTPVRHYVVCMVDPSSDSPRNWYGYWCDAPEGWLMCLWDIQPHRVRTCFTCVKQASAIGQSQENGIARKVDG